MYYESNEIDNELLCSLYKTRLNEPRILPCGNSICFSCSTKIILTMKNQFQCVICNDLHEMPKNGLPINKILIKMLSTSLIKVSRGKYFDLMKNLLNQVQSKRDRIKHTIENSGKLITEYFNGLRSEIR
jgi:hypothetical protein